MLCRRSRRQTRPSTHFPLLAPGLAARQGCCPKLPLLVISRHETPKEIVYLIRYRYSHFDAAHGPRPTAGRPLSASPDTDTDGPLWGIGKPGQSQPLFLPLFSHHLWRNFVAKSSETQQFLGIYEILLFLHSLWRFYSEVLAFYAVNGAFVRA
ncbi:hypothetical protein GGR57DRAFT_212014 [Xylariaceae sp. FL1272]|nr:hypothetical protein GGR57DRAFT_212014 [Xylariaceae sp. FL1272]